jgi:hypothetical protein
MNKSLLLIMMVMVGGAAMAKDVTKEAFLATKKAAAEKAGKTQDEAKDMGYFNKVDTNKDGVMSDAEAAAYKEAQAAAAAAKKGVAK